MYALIHNDHLSVYPLSLAQWRIDHPRVSIPNEPSEDQLNEQGIYSVEISQAPQYNHEVNLQDTAERQADGKWKQVWVSTPASAEEITYRTNGKADAIRCERNQKLTQSDWTQLTDAPVDATAWATYRQALRDITSQVGFPWDVQWPDQPQ